MVPPAPEPHRPIGHREFAARRRFANLDGLRCISIVAVLWYHMPVSWRAMDIGPMPAPLTRGFLGVDLFFVLSGFLITTLLLRERDRRGRIALGAFYMRRTLRIFPLYYAVLTAMALWIANDPLIIATGANVAFFERMPHYVTYTANLAPDELIFSPSWSLATEEQFYLLWPPLLALAAAAVRGLALAALLGASVAANFGAFHHLPLHPAFAAAGCTPILLGLLLAFALHHRPAYDRVSPLLGARWVIAVPAALIVACLFAPPPADPVQPGDLRGWPRIGVHVGMAWLVGCAAMRERGLASAALQWRPAQWIGRISYGIYLFQIPVLLFITLRMFEAHQRVSWLPIETLWLGPLFALASVALATASWFTLERGFLRLKGRFQR